MINRTSLTKYFKHFYESPLPQLYPRQFKFYKSVTSKPHVLVGARRVGKTYILFQKMRELLAEGIRKSQILYINCEDPDFSEILPSDFTTLIEFYWEIFPEEIEEKLFLFFDEMQTINHWEKGIRAILDKFHFQIFITGSSSKLLSQEISTSLRGRAIQYSITTLNFIEFLNFREFNSIKNGKDLQKLSSKGSAKLNSLFREYLEYGGYPEVVLETNLLLKRKILQEYYNLVIYRDLIERNRLTTGIIFKEFIRILMQKFGREINVKQIYNQFKSRGYKISKEQLYSYFDILEDACIIYSCRKFNPSLQKQLNAHPKYYLHDFGFYSLFNLDNYGIRFENLIFLDIFRTKEWMVSRSINFWKNSTQTEDIDFIISDGEEVRYLIQVSLSMEEKETRVREFSGLLKTWKKYELFNKAQGIILTENEDNFKLYEGKKVNIYSYKSFLISKMINK